MTTLINGAPYLRNQELVAIVDEATWNVQRDVDVIDGHIATTIVLPSNPEPGRSYLLLASGGDMALDGNGHGIALGVSSIPEGESATISFSEPAGQWLVAAGGAIMGGSPAAPIGAFQYNLDGTDFGAAGWSFLLPNTVYSRLDSLKMTFADSVASADYVMFEAGNNGTGDAQNPPGATANFGTNQAYTLGAQVPNAFYWGGNLAAIGVGDGFDAIYAFGVGSQFNNVDPALTIAGGLVYSNLLMLPVGVFPHDGMLGGGNGARFNARAETVPTVHPSTEVAGLLDYINPFDNLPYGWTTSNHRIPLFAQPAFVTFGAATVPTSGRSYLFPGFANTVAGESLLQWAVPLSGYVDEMLVLSFSVIVQSAGTGTGSLQYTLVVNGVDTVMQTDPILVTDGDTIAQIDVAFPVESDDEIAIAVDVIGSVTGSPANIICSMAINANPDV